MAADARVLMGAASLPIGSVSGGLAATFVQTLQGLGPVAALKELLFHIPFLNSINECIGCVPVNEILGEPDRDPVGRLPYDRNEYL